MLLLSYCIAIFFCVFYNSFGDDMINVLQFGEGNFLRAFADYYFQLAKNNGDFNSGIAVCQPRKNTKIINLLKSQSCRYNVLLRGKLNGKIIDRAVEINCIENAVDTVVEYQLLEKIFCSDSLKVIVSNTTEAGIVFDENDRLADSPDVSFPAKLCALLLERFNKKLGGLVFLPVELIENNGNTLKSCIIQYAEHWKLGAGFVDYINNECSFCNTLVDRIVTGYTEYENDKCAVACEPYGSFIIEADERARAVLPFENISDVRYVQCIAPYRERKVKILNCAHTMSIHLAYEMGFTIVRDMIEDNSVYEFIKNGIFGEVIPTINLPDDELRSFAYSVFERFGNPFIDHKLSDISLNSIAKFRARCLPSIIDYYNMYGSLPEHLCLGLAGLINFYIKEDANDDKEKIEFIKNNSVNDILSNSDIWGMDLTETGNMSDVINNYIDSINTLGVRKTMESIDE